MKKILLLGGSAQQVIAISTAKRLGYETILCDFLADNPGQYEADKFYLVSTTDKEAVLEIAKQEKVDGVLAYASDPAAPTAAYVAEQLGLPGNPYESVEILCNKDKFRRFLSENGYNAPKTSDYENEDDLLREIDTFQLPIVIKPVDSSGSKGITVLHTLENVEQAIKLAFSFSRKHRIIVEEFIEKKHTYLVGGDIFVVDGKIVLWGLMNCHRDNRVNPLVPVGKSYPLELDELDVKRAKDVLQQLVDKLHIQNSAMNIELILDTNDRVWLIDIGPRSGGNMIPDLLNYIFDVDVVEMSVKVAMGEQLKMDDFEGVPYYATHNLHVTQNGFFSDINFAPELDKYIIKKCIYKRKGDTVEYFDNAAKALGIVFMKFESKAEMDYMLENIYNCISIQII